MINLTKKNRLGIILGVFIILGLIVYFVFIPGAFDNGNSNTLKPTASRVPLNQPPRYFPPNVFKEPDARIIDSYNTTFPDGRIWATIVYETSASADKLKTDYQSYFRSLEKWNVGKIYLRGENIFLSAAKDKESLVVSFADKSGSGKTMVTVSYQIGK